MDFFFSTKICAKEGHSLQAMKRRRSSESVNDTAAVLGCAVDELMRHQNSLRVPAIKAVINLLKKLVVLGNDPDIVCVKMGNSPSANAEKAARANEFIRPVAEVEVAESQSDDDTEETIDEDMESILVEETIGLVFRVQVIKK